MNKVWIAFLLSLLALGLKAQEEIYLDQLNLLKQKITAVDLGRYQYEQQLDYEQDNPFEINISIEETDTRRSKSESISTSFNLALLNKNMVRRSTSKTEMKVVLRTSKNILQIYEDGEWDGYDDQFEIICQDIEHAKSLEKVMKETIVLAQKAWQEANPIPDEIVALLAALTSSVEDVEIGDNSIEQSIEQNDEYMDIVTIQQSDKEEMSLGLSLGDLNPKSVEYDVKGDKVFLEAKTRKDRQFIRLKKGEETEYTDELQLFLPAPAKAAFIVDVLKKVIPLCDSLIQLRLPKPTQQQDAADVLQTLLVPYTINEDSYNQKINTGCKSNYTIAEEGEKETETLEYKFNWGNIDPKSKTIKVSKAQIEIALSVKGKQNYVELRENGTLKGFDNKLSLYAPDAESARAILAILDSMIAGCPVQLKAKDLQWLNTHLEAISDLEEDYGQSISADSDDPCQLTLAITDEADSEQYEFDLSDISRKSIELDIKSRRIELSMETKNDEESINHYDEKGDLSYEKDLEFFFSTVEAGRIGLLTFKAMVEGCEE